MKLNICITVFTTSSTSSYFKLYSFNSLLTFVATDERVIMS